MKPNLGQGMESGTIVRWLKSEGESVKKREPLYELDTDKVTQEVESDLDGVLLKIVVPEGEVEVGSTIAVIEAAGAAAGDDSCGGTRGAGRGVRRPLLRLPRRSRPPRPLPRRRATVTPRARWRCPQGGRIKASPLARRIARERGLDLSTLTGTGPDGRIVAEDVERAQPGSRGAPAPEPLGSRGRRGRGRCDDVDTARRSPAASPRHGRPRSSSSASRST